MQKNLANPRTVPCSVCRFNYFFRISFCLMKFDWFFVSIIICYDLDIYVIVFLLFFVVILCYTAIVFCQTFYFLCRKFSSGIPVPTSYLAGLHWSGAVIQRLPSGLSRRFARETRRQRTALSQRRARLSVLSSNSKVYTTLDVLRVRRRGLPQDSCWRHRAVRRLPCVVCCWASVAFENSRNQGILACISCQ